MKRPDFEWFPSPNFKPYATKRVVSCVVLHATATAKIESPRDWLCSPMSKVSAHYLVGLDGKILRLVDENNVAFHAGVSEWRGVQHVNNFSIGIEIVNSNDGKMAYPGLQLAALGALCIPICQDYKIAPEDVIGHLDIAPGRKTDPAGFPWDSFRTLLRGGKL